MPALRMMAKAAKERSRKRQAQEAANRRQEEFLRTGRAEPLAQEMPPQAGVLQAPPTHDPQSATPPISSDDQAKRRLAEIAQRRRAELERLARATKPTSTSAPAPAPAPARAPSPAPHVRRNPVFVSPTPPRQQRAAVPDRQFGSPPLPARKLKAPKEAKSPSAATPTLTDFHSASAAASEDSNVVHRLVKDLPPEHVAETGALLKSLALKPGSADLRRAFLLSEIFARPLSQRDL